MIFVFSLLELPKDLRGEAAERYFQQGVNDISMWSKMPILFERDFVPNDTREKISNDFFAHVDLH